MNKEYEQLFKEVEDLIGICKMPELTEAYNKLMNAFKGVVPDIDKDLPNIYPENFGDWGKPLIYDPKKYVRLVTTVRNKAREYLLQKDKEELYEQANSKASQDRIAQAAKEEENSRIVEILVEKKLHKYKVAAISFLSIFVLVLITGLIFLAFYIIGNVKDEAFLNELQTFSLIYSVISIPFGLIGAIVGLIIKLTFVNHKERIEKSIRNLLR